MEMEYEFLLRSIYQCGRDYKIGADADIYREMDFAQNVIDDPNWAKSKSEKEYDFQVKFSKVRNYLSKAINMGMYQVFCEADDKMRLKKMLAELTLNFYNRNRLDAIIVEAGEIFRKYGLKA